MLFNSIAIAALVGAMGVEAASKPVSRDARCGQKFGKATCEGSKWGNCCSQYGYVFALSIMDCSCRSNDA